MATHSGFKNMGVPTKLLISQLLLILDYHERPLTYPCIIPTIEHINQDIIESEVRHTSVQSKRKAKLPTVIGLTTMHAVCCNTLFL